MKKILVIEDQPLVRANILEILELEEFDVVGAENGLFGALWAQEHLPDLIICDINMPAPNRYEVLRQLRRDPATANIIVLFLTFETDIASRRQALQLGANGYLSKPVDLNELLSAIATLLQSN